LGELLETGFFTEKLRMRVKEANVILRDYGQKPVNFKTVLNQYLEVGEKIRPLITNTVLTIHKAIGAGKEILFEGAQGTFLDLDHGTYPYVTSSNTTAGGACTGSGVPPNRIDRVVGAMKAYTTRVGEGPFPTQDRVVADLMHSMGREYGAVTGRERRCGWFDSVATRYAQILNGIDELAVTNLDGLDSLPRLKVCVAYKLDGKKIEVPPTCVRRLARCVPVYVEVAGWEQPTTAARSFEELPAAAKEYLRLICELTGAKLKLVGVGQSRAQTILVWCPLQDAGFEECPRELSNMSP
jgi:adenylosuccinate synthase